MTDSTNRMLQNMMKTTTQHHKSSDHKSSEDGDNFAKDEDVSTDMPRFAPIPAPAPESPKLATVMTNILNPRNRKDNTPI